MMNVNLKKIKKGNGALRSVLLLLSLQVGASSCLTNDDFAPLTGEETGTIQTIVNGPVGNSAITFSPDAVAFGSLVVNSVSPLQVITVKNTSAFNLVLGNTTGATSEFALIGSTCTNGLSFAPGATCTLSLEFTPSYNSSFSTIFSIDYTAESATGTFQSILNITGSGTTLTGFGGLSSISNVTSTKMKLNWTGVAGASSYQIYRIIGSNATLLTSETAANVCVGMVCAYNITGATPTTAYTYRVRASDAGGIQDGNIVNRASTTAISDVFVTGTLNATEGITSTFDLNTVCTDQFSGGRVYAQTAQSSVNASPNCSVAGNLLTCTPPYINKSGTHANWAETATVSCVVDGNTLSQVFSIAVAGTTLIPTAANSTVSVSPASVTADGVTSSTVTVTLKDAVNVKAPGRTVTLTSSRGATDTISAASGVSTAGGVVTFSVTSTTVGSPTFTAVDTSDSVTITQQPSITFTPGVADHLVKIAGDAQSATLNSSVAIDPKVQVVDRYGNAVVSGVDLSFLVSRGGGQLSTYKVTSDASGYASTKFYSGANDPTSFIDVKRIGTALPDLAGSGKSIVQFTETSSSSGNGTFYGPMYPTLSGSVYSIATADLNGDGFPDMVIPQMTGNKVRVFLGTASGIFQTPVDYAFGTNAPTSVAIADFNGDGKKDLVVTNWANGKVSIMLGNGDGTFQAKVDYTTGVNCNGVAVGDFNADGKLDLAVACSSSNTISILLGNGNGTFGAKADTAITGPTYIYTKDFNGDGKLDLVVGNNGNVVTVYLGNGNGTFGAPVTYATQNGTNFMAIDDFNGDGFLDLAVPDWYSGKLSILLGNGNGTFQAKVDYAAATNPGQIEARDLNGDGFKDLIVGNSGSGTISVYMGIGNGTFAAKVEYPAGSLTRDIALADFDGDGKLDVAFASNGSPNEFGVLSGNGDGTFKVAGTTTYATGVNPYRVHTADFNGDGALDIAVSNYGSNTMSIYLGNKTAGVPNGTFAAKVDYATGANPYNLISGDFNEDGALDLAVANYTGGSVSVFLGNKTAGVPNGTFAAKVDYPVGANPRGIALADFNNDGHLDMVVANLISNNVTVLLGAGDGSFTNTLTLTTGIQPFHVISGDFNGDGKQDFAVTSYSTSAIHVFLGKGDGTFQPKVDYTTPNNPNGICAADLNGDGKLDLVTSNTGGQNFSLFSGNGDGTFAAPVTTQLGTINPYSVKCSDFNHDGKIDIVLLGNLTNEMDVILGNGNGTFQTKAVYQEDLAPTDVALGDFNGDGKIDTAVVNFTSNTLKLNFGK